ncbi:hypothetical protein MXD59_22520 [Frankia sp. Ag45/Mut15]|uniref:SGNH hydrolase-type esterase domain-containing protein n=1 Tax=Frankia umida TaxID=573489 RepID=A0ABT0K3W1_9ACTN|nr:hypothetical protein [Frankia umida]MCK9878504.1 hypothetical protein [Frankia umida]
MVIGRTRRLSPISWLFVTALVLVAGTWVVQHPASRTRSVAGQRVVLWGDSLAWEAGAVFTRDVEADRHATALVRTWGGTAPCDWLPDLAVQLRAFRPTVAALAFSGNEGTPCMRGRDLVAAYRADVGQAVDQLTAAGVAVVLVEAPPRSDQPVDAAGRTALDRVWQRIAADHRPGGVVTVAPAGRVVTDNGRFTPTLHCTRGETCGPSGFVTVRSPDGTHFCPLTVPPMTPCPLPSPGAARYGAAIATATLSAGADRDGGSGDPAGGRDAASRDGTAVQAELIPPGQVGTVRHP